MPFPSAGIPVSPASDPIPSARKGAALLLRRQIEDLLLAMANFGAHATLFASDLAPSFA